MVDPRLTRGDDSQPEVRLELTNAERALYSERPHSPLLEQSVYVVRALLHNAGYDVWSWGDRALLRAFAWLHEQAAFPASRDDTWQPHVVNFYYGTHFPAPVPSRPGKNVGWTDWSHAPAAARATISPENHFAKR